MNVVTDNGYSTNVCFQKMMIGVLWPLLCTWQAKWAKRPPKVMKLR